MEKVKILKIDDKNKAQENYKQGSALLEKALGEYAHLFKKGERVLVKPNLLSARERSQAVTTHPETLDCVLEFLIKIGTKPFVADSPPDGNGYEVAKKTGLIAVCEKHGVEFEELDQPVTITHNGSYDFKLAKKVIEADKIVNLAKIKTHSLTILTLAVKNMFGCVVGREKASWHFKALNNNNFAKLMVEICAAVSPDLSIVDGIRAHEGNGPSNGSPKDLGVIFIGENAFAVDDCIARSLSVKVNKYPILIEAAKKGLIPDYEVEGQWKGSIKLPTTSPVLSGLNSIANKFNFFKKRPKIVEDKCIKCRKCERSCPVEAIKIDDLSIDYSKCIRCYVCHEVCPEDAINLVGRLF